MSRRINALDNDTEWSDGSSDSTEESAGPSMAERLREHMQRIPRDHPDLPNYYVSLGHKFAESYQVSQELDDLELAISMKQEAANITPGNHPDRASRLQTLAIHLSLRFERVGDLENLEQALQNLGDALNLVELGSDADRAVCLQNLGQVLRRRYRRLGDLKDLEEALKNDRTASHLTPEDHPYRAARLLNLAVALGERYKRLGNFSDLEESLKCEEKALQLTPETHPDRHARLQNVSISLHARYQRLGNSKDLEEALEYQQKALSLIPKGHPDRALCLQNLAMSFMDRYKGLDNVEDIDQAVRSMQEALNLTPEDHPYRAYSLQNLAQSLGARHNRLGNLTDLEQAVQHQQGALSLTPEGHLDRATYLLGLAISLSDRYQKLQEPKDLDAANRYFSEALSLPTSIPESSWEAALKWASLAEQFQPTSCITAFKAAFRLLPELLWLGHSIPLRHDAVRRLDLATATSTAFQICLTLRKLTTVLEIFEQGLATVFQQTLQLKVDVHRLPPHQAQEFQRLSTQLYTGMFTDPMSVVNDWHTLLKNIRNQPGLEYFLLPRSYKELCKASQAGPIVILNSHKNSCDAIIILDPVLDPVHVSLKVTLGQLESQRTFLKQLLGHCHVRSRGESPSSRLFGKQECFMKKSSAESFEELLIWLWTNIVQPVYQVLASHSIHEGRLWWLPTGAFMGLPLHACPPADEFIHSYTPTLGSLAESYANLKNQFNSTVKVGIVGVTHTGLLQENFLPGVSREIKDILSVVPESNVDSLEGSQATVEAVKLQLQNCSWLHLACHGKQDLTEPIKSHLLLYGGSLDLETILQLSIPKAEVVFLAACQTAMGDSQLVNESFHLGGGLIAAGFKGAIGTMWSMNDQDGPRVAKVVYSHLFQDGRVPRASDAAKALHLAVRKLKKMNVAHERWIPFIHMGV